MSDIPNIDTTTENILANTEVIKKTGVKSYNQERHKRVWDALFYSYQRTDILLIAISSGGIYVCLETIKFFAENHLPAHWLIKLSALLFLLAVVLNFFSQMCASRAHAHDYQIVDAEITCEENNTDITIYQTQIDSHEKKSRSWNSANEILSGLAVICMSTGLAALVFFFCFIF